MEDKEKQLLIRQLERHKKNKVKLTESIEYNKGVIDLNKFNRDFSDKWSEYKRTLKEQEEQEGLKMIESEIKNIDKHIEELKKEIDNPKNKTESYLG